MQTVLITGGTRGIGRATAIALAEASPHRLLLNYVQNDAAAEETAGEVRKRGSECILLRANIGDPDAADAMFRTIGEVPDPHLDAFVHCAALTSFKPPMDIRLNQWDLTMNINARGFLYCVQKCVPLMSGGSIVAISSLGSGHVMPAYGSMGATKAALESLVRYLAVDLATKGIRVNGVSGGLVETESIRAFPDADAVRKQAIARTPMGRIGTPEEIAAVVQFLLTPASNWICGQIIVADGGLSLT